MKGKEVNVHIGEVKVAAKGEVLRAILGSCVGIGFIWRRKGVCGLAHCLLGELPAPTFSIGARFVEQAVPSLIALMRIKAEDVPEIEVVLVGGGNMTQPKAKNPEKLVGSENFCVAQRELKKRGFKILHSDHAKEEGRRISIDSRDCSFVVEAIPRETAAAA